MIPDPMTEEEIEQMACAWPKLGGRCGYCQRNVSNAADKDHRVTPITAGGRGVECKHRGDFR